MLDLHPVHKGRRCIRVAADFDGGGGVPGWIERQPRRISEQFADVLDLFFRFVPCNGIPQTPYDFVRTLGLRDEPFQQVPQLLRSGCRQQADAGRGVI